LHSLYYRRSILDEPSVALSPSDVSVDPIDVDEVTAPFVIIMVCTQAYGKVLILTLQDVSFLRNGTKWKRVSY